MPDALHLPPALTAAPDRGRFPAVTGDATADVVVVGGSVVGVLTALALVERGATVVLLERRHVLTGESAYTTGFLSRVPDASLGQLRRVYGAPYVRDLLAAGREAQGWLMGLLATAPAAALQHCDTFIFSRQSSDPAIEELWQAIQDLDPGTDRVTPAPAADAVQVRDEGWAELRPGLLGLLERKPEALRIFEESAVNEIRVERRDVHVRTLNSTVRAQAAILASGNPSPLIPSLRLLLRPAVTYVSLLRYPVEAPLPVGLWWDTVQPYHYLRRTDARTIMVGGADEFLPRTTNEPASTRHVAIEQFTTGWLGGEPIATHRWSGTIYHSPDGLPLVGTDPQRGPAVAFATGFSGNGLVHGALTARMLAAQATGGRHAAAALFDPARLKKGV